MIHALVLVLSLAGGAPDNDRNEWGDAPAEHGSVPAAMAPPSEAPVPSKPADQNALLLELTDEIRQALGDLEKHSKEASAANASAARRAAKMPADGSDAFVAKWNVLAEPFQSFPALNYLPLQDQRSDSAAKLSAAIKKTLALLEEENNCALGGREAMSSKKCQGHFAACKVRFGAKAGELYRASLGPGLSLIRSPTTPVRSFDVPVPRDTPFAVSGNRMTLLCEYYAAAGFEFEPERVATDPSPECRWRISTDGALLDVCPKPLDFAVLQDQLASLRRKHPTMAAGLADCANMLKNRAMSCERRVQQDCSMVFPVGNTFGLAYLTQDCKVRRVTANDVREDIKRAYTWTEVDRIEHSGLAERIEMCAELSGRGWTWDYEPPTTKGCKKSE